MTSGRRRLAMASQRFKWLVQDQDEDVGLKSSNVLWWVFGRPDSGGIIY